MAVAISKVHSGPEEVRRFIRMCRRSHTVGRYPRMQLPRQSIRDMIRGNAEQRPPHHDDFARGSTHRTGRKESAARRRSCTYVNCCTSASALSIYKMNTATPVTRSRISRYMCGAANELYLIFACDSPAWPARTREKDRTASRKESFGSLVLWSDLCPPVAEEAQVVGPSKEGLPCLPIR